MRLCELFLLVPLCTPSSVYSVRDCWFYISDRFFGLVSVEFAIEVNVAFVFNLTNSSKKTQTFFRRVRLSILVLSFHSCFIILRKGLIIFRHLYFHLYQCISYICYQTNKMFLTFVALILGFYSRFKM